MRVPTYSLSKDREGVVGGISLFVTQTIKVTLVRRFQTKLTAGVVAGSGEHSKWTMARGKPVGLRKVTNDQRNWQVDQGPLGKPGACEVQSLCDIRNLTVELRVEPRDSHTRQAPATLFHFFFLSLLFSTGFLGVA